VVQEVSVDVDRFGGVARQLRLGVAVGVAGLGLLVPEAEHVPMYHVRPQRNH
jgi:hypothetical protein